MDTYSNYTLSRVYATRDVLSLCAVSKKRVDCSVECNVYPTTFSTSNQTSCWSQEENCKADLSGRGLQSDKGSSAEAEENVFALIHTAIEASAIHLSHYLHYCENVFLSNSFLRTRQYPFHILCRFLPGGSYQIKNLSAAPPQAWLWCCQRAEALHRRLV